MENEKELQEKMLLYRLLESRLEALVRQRELVTNKAFEINSTISSIEEIEKNQEDILFKLGGEAYAHGKVVDNGTILVEIGAGVVLEKPVQEGKNILIKRREEMENALKELSENISKISGSINQITPEINELIQKNQSENTAG